MRLATVIFAGSVVALLASAPALAKNPESQGTGAKSEPAPCHSYQQAADGSWEKVPCEEAGNGQTQHRTATKTSGEERR